MKMKRILLLMLVLAIGMGMLTACNTNESETTEAKPTVAYTSDVLVANGKTDYSIVIPEKATRYNKFAASELQILFKEATGVELPIISDEGITWSDDGRYISIGHTALESAVGITCDYSEYKNSGARLLTKGKSIFLTGSIDEGALYAVYDFLNIVLGYEFYDVDAYALTQKESINLPMLDLVDIPDIDYRQFGDFEQYTAVGGTEEHSFRLRYRYWNQDRALDGHASLALIPESTYFSIHRDWFSTESGLLGNRELHQLCYTNEEMKAEFIKNLKKVLEEKPETTFVSIAQEDVNVWCKCDKCVETMEKYGCGTSNLGAITQNLFVNDVVKEVDAWLEENFPGRNMTYYILAYHQTETAPAHKDENGNWVANAPELILPDNVMVSYASIYTNRNMSFRDNSTENAKIKAWSAVSSNLCIYEYPGNAAQVCMPYDGLHVFADNVRFAVELGFGSYYMQGNYNTKSSAFTGLKAYVASKLMWDSTLDPNKLAYDYLKNVYGDASSYMVEYYDLLRTYLSQLREEQNYGSGVFQPAPAVNTWPLTTMKSFQKSFDKAYNAIEPLKDSDPEQYEVLFRKIMVEEMFLRYVDCSLYLNYYTDEEKVAKIDEFEYYATKYGFNNFSETSPMSTVIAQWRSQL